MDAAMTIRANSSNPGGMIWAFVCQAVGVVRFEIGGAVFLFEGGGLIAGFTLPLRPGYYIALHGLTSLEPRPLYFCRVGLDWLLIGSSVRGSF